jgi:hypothetical protein
MEKEKTVLALIKDVQDNLTNASASHKDEVRIMQAFLNDTSYEVGIYDKTGKVGVVAPAKEFRSVISNAIVATTKISKEEADSLVAGYEAKKSDAESMLTVSKEFLNTYLQTNRKIGLGGREKSNVSLIKKEIKESTRSYPKQVGVDAAGKPIYEKAEVKVSPYDSIKVSSPCPAWIKK